MSRFNVCNLIELLTQLALVFAGASPHSRDNSVLTTMQSFEEVSPQHSVIAQFFKDNAMFPPQTRESIIIIIISS